MAEHKLGDQVVVTLGGGQLAVGTVVALLTELSIDPKGPISDVKEYTTYGVADIHEGKRYRLNDSQWLPHTAIHKDLSQISWMKPFLPKVDK